MQYRINSLINKLLRCVCALLLSGVLAAGVLAAGALCFLLPVPASAAGQTDTSDAASVYTLLFSRPPTFTDILRILRPSIMSTASLTFPIRCATDVRSAASIGKIVLCCWTAAIFSRAIRCRTC